MTGSVRNDAKDGDQQSSGKDQGVRQGEQQESRDRGDLFADLLTVRLPLHQPEEYGHCIDRRRRIGPGLPAAHRGGVGDLRVGRAVPGESVQREAEARGQVYSDLTVGSSDLRELCWSAD